MTNLDKKLDVILAKHGAEEGEMTHSLKQAILDWHNKQVEEVLIGFAKEADTEYRRSQIYEWLFSLGLIVHKAIIEAEHNRRDEQL